VNIYSNRTDLYIGEESLKSLKVSSNEVKVLNDKTKSGFYKTIVFDEVNEELLDILTEEVSSFFEMFNMSKSSHIFVVGLGNENYTADAVGPLVLKHVNVNSYLEVLGINIDGVKVSALEPGVLSTTGIPTKETVKSVVRSINPDFIILIDAFVVNSTDYLNKTIVLNDIGLSIGSGLIGINEEINSMVLGVPTMVIGVPTAIEVRFGMDSNYKPYLLSTQNIDTYVMKISEIIGTSINRAINNLK